MALSDFTSFLGGISPFINMAMTGIENMISRQREDNAVQRRMADISAAGFNPMLSLNGSISSASSSPMQAPYLESDKVLSSLEHKYQVENLKAGISEAKARKRALDDEHNYNSWANEWYKTNGIPAGEKSEFFEFYKILSFLLDKSGYSVDNVVDKVKDVGGKILDGVDDVSYDDVKGLIKDVVDPVVSSRVRKSEVKAVTKRESGKVANDDFSSLQRDIPLLMGSEYRVLEPSKGVYVIQKYQASPWRKGKGQWIYVQSFDSMKALRNYALKHKKS